MQIKRGRNYVQIPHGGCYQVERIDKNGRVVVVDGNYKKIGKYKKEFIRLLKGPLAKMKVICKEREKEKIVSKDETEVIDDLFNQVLIYI